MSEQVIATKGNLIAISKSLSLAKTGFELLERKNNILVRETMSMVGRAEQLSERIDAAYRLAYDALQTANITLGIVDNIAAAVPTEQSLSLTLRSVMGVELPRVEIDRSAPRNCYGYSGTNEALDEAFIRFDEVKRLTAELAEVECSVYRLATAIKKTQKRRNALRNIVIPRLSEQIAIISDALAEKEREEFTRMKVIKKSK